MTQYKVNNINDHDFAECDQSQLAVNCALVRRKKASRHTRRFGHKAKLNDLLHILPTFAEIN